MRRAIRKHRSTLIIGLIATALLAGLTFAAEAIRNREDAQRLANGQLDAIQDRLLMANAELQAAAAYISQVNPAVSSLDDFVRHLPLSRNGSVGWIWSKITTPGDIESLEREVRSEMGSSTYHADRTSGAAFYAPIVMTLGEDIGVHNGQDLAAMPGIADVLSEDAASQSEGTGRFAIPQPSDGPAIDRLFLAIRLPPAMSNPERASRASLLLRVVDLATLAQVSALHDKQVITVRDMAGSTPRLLLGTLAPAGAGAVLTRDVEFPGLVLQASLTVDNSKNWPWLWALVASAGLLFTGLLVTVKAGQFIRTEANTLSAELSDTQMELLSIQRKEISFFENSGTANCETDFVTGKLIRVNDLCCAMLGYDRRELIGRSFASITHPSDVALSKAALKGEAGKPREHMQFEKRYIRKDGSVMWAMVNAKLHYGKTGQPETYSTVIIDITARKNDEETKALLLRELAHRVRNTVQLTSSLARQTARTARSVKEYDAKFHLRLAALSSAQDLLFDTGWQAASLNSIAGRILAPFLPDRSGKDVARIDLPAVNLPTQQTQTIALALHELASNSAQFGALGHGGTLHLTGELSSVPETGRKVLTLRWDEKSGKRTRRPRKTGFGTIMLESALPEQFEGTAKLTYRSQGLLYEAKLLVG